MAIGRRLFKKYVRRAFTRVFDRIGGKVVSGMADTSSDAPSAAFKPKRNLYAKMKEEEEAARRG